MQTPTSQLIDLINFLPVILGLISGWALFELTEWRRRSRARSALRKALVVELESAEVLASSIVGKYARMIKTKEEIAIIATEIRWLQNVGKDRLRESGVLSDLKSMPEAFDSLTDDQLVALHSTIEETIGVSLIMPVLENVLANRTEGFSAPEIQTLSMVRWQTYLLTQDVEHIKLLFHMSFTSADSAVNHEIVRVNHEKKLVDYAKRVQTLLRVIRSALQKLR